jgi:hypothetical protein
VIGGSARESLVFVRKNREGMGTMEKPYKGALKNWHRKYRLLSGYVIIGENNAGQRKTTSSVLKHNQATGEIETLNSRYTLIGPEKHPIGWRIN